MLAAEDSPALTRGKLSTRQRVSSRGENLVLNEKIQNIMWFRPKVR